MNERIYEDIENNNIAFSAGREGTDTSPQSFIITLSLSFALVTFIEFDCLFHLVNCPNVSTTNCNIQEG